MIVDKSWFMFDTNIGSLVLQRLGFFSDNALKRTTKWRNILRTTKSAEYVMVGRPVLPAVLGTKQ